MTFAIEPIVNPTLEIPAPVVSVPQAGDRARGSSPSFQDHLKRAGESGDGPGGSSDTNRTDRNRSVDRTADPAADEADRDHVAEDRIDAQRHDEASSGDMSATDSNAARSGDPKSKRIDKDAKVDGKKKTKEKDEEVEGEQASDPSVAVVAVGIAPDAGAAKEAASTADEIVAAAEADPTKTSSPKLDKKSAADSSIDPTSIKKELPGGDAKAGAKGGNTDEQVAAALQAAEANNEGVKQPAAAVVGDAPAAPVVSELHSTKLGARNSKQAKADVEADDAAAHADATANIVGDAASTKPVIEPDAGTAARGSGAEQGPAKGDTATGLNADPSFAAQLQGAVETAAAAPTVATTAEVSAASNLGDTTTAAAAAPASTEAAKGPTAKTGDVTLTTAEALRGNSAKDAVTKRAGGEESRQADGLSTADRSRLVQRVARAVRTAQDRGGELQIRLSPPELGQLRLQVQMTDGTLSARIEAESPQAKQLITENLGQLRERLAEQNVRVDRIDVELMNTGNGGSPNLPDRRNDFSQDGPMPRGFATNSRRGNSGDAAAVETSATNIVAASNGRLNVVI